MISLSNSALVVLFEDGSRRTFEVEELQTRLLQSFISAGIRENWLAEDVALAVEYVLRKIGNEDRLFSFSEVNCCVAKVLEDAGFPEVAENFRSRNSIRRLEVAPDHGTITSVLSKHTGSSGDELERLSRRVADACAAIGISKVSPSLALELARHFRESDFEGKTVEAPVPNVRHDSPWLVSAEEIVSKLSPAAWELAEKGVIRPNPVSRLFPSVKIDLRLSSLAKSAGIVGHVTELGLAPHVKKLSSAFEEIADVSERIYMSGSGGDAADCRLPVYLKIADAALFSKEYLGAEWPSSASCIRDIALLIAGQSDREISLMNLPAGASHHVS